MLTFASFGAPAVAAQSRTGSQNSMVGVVKVQIGFIDRHPRHPVVTRGDPGGVARVEIDNVRGTARARSPRCPLGVWGVGFDGLPDGESVPESQSRHGLADMVSSRSRGPRTLDQPG